MAILAVSALLIVANGTPLVLSNLLGQRANWRIDGGVTLADGRALFGATKTWRGLAGSLIATTLLAILLGLGWQVGLLVAAGAMVGDLLSSFSKRRLGFASSARAPGLDQLPEALLPALGLYFFFSYPLWLVLIATLLFVAVDVGLSPLLFRWGLRRVPH